jgi:hypothetical protein
MTLHYIQNYKVFPTYVGFLHPVITIEIEVDSGISAVLVSYI